MAVRFDIHEIKKILLALSNQTCAFGFFYESKDDWRLMIGDEQLSVQEVDKHAAFGLIAYDAKNRYESLSSDNPASIQWSDFELIKAHTVVVCEKSHTCIAKGEKNVLDDLLNLRINSAISVDPLRSVKTFSPDAYKKKVAKALREIRLGNVYEINICEESVYTGLIDPLEIFTRIIAVTEAPYCALVKLDDRFIISGSPELFLKKKGSKIHSSPIKGTARRSQDLNEDTELATNLVADPKERAENTMIVDLVRNDLSRIALKGTVHVESYCVVKSFKTVHQLESTIACRLKPEVKFEDVLRATFPMGSMTGAPKIAAMNLIEQLEDFKRGAYSGSIGFTDGEGDFVLNVIIRSVLFDRANKIVSFASGGAITYDSVPEREMEELLLKSDAMKMVLGIE